MILQGDSQLKTPQYTPSNKSNSSGNLEIDLQVSFEKSSRNKNCDGSNCLAFAAPKLCNKSDPRNLTPESLKLVSVGVTIL